MNLLDIFKAYMLNHKHELADKSYETYKYMFKSWKNKLKLNTEKQIREFSPSVIQHLALRIKSQLLAPATINLQLTILRNMLKFHETINTTPTHWQLLTNIKNKKHEINILTKQDCDQLIQLTRTTASQPLIVLSTLLLSGLRISEALNLKKEDINIANRSIFVSNGKGSKQRTTFMLDPLPEILQQYIDTIPDRHEYLFTSRATEKKLTRAYINNTATKLNLSQPVYPHLLRHTYATILAAKDLDVFTLQKILGHSDIRTTQAYTHPRVEDLQASFTRTLSLNGSPF